MSNSQSYIDRPSWPLQNLIRCCGEHLEYPVPVIFTFKWDYFEYWCPLCGRKYEFFDGFKYYPDSEILKKRIKFFEEMSKDYLSDNTDSFTLYQKPDHE